MTDIPQNNKRIAKNTIFLYFRSILLILISLYTTRVVLRVLGTYNYGIYNLVGGVVAMFSMLSGSMATASQRYITYALGLGDKKHLQQVFSTSHTLHLALACILAVCLEIAGSYFLGNGLNIPEDSITAARWVLHCSVLSFFFNVISVPYNALIIAYERMNFFAYIGILDAALKLGAVFLLQALAGNKLILYAVMIAIIAVIQRVIYTIYCRRNFEAANNLSYKIDGKLFKEMFAFAGWNLWGSGSAVLRTQGVDIIMNLFFGVVSNAAKGISNQVQNAIYQFVTNFQTAVVPQLTMAIAAKDNDRVHNLIINGSRLSFFLLTIFAVPLLTSTHGVLQLWLSEVPEYSVSFIRWTLISLLLDCLSRFLMQAIQAHGDIRNYQIIVGGTKLLVLPIAYFVFKSGGNPAAGIWINIIVDFGCLIERLYFNRKQLGLSPAVFVRKVFVRCWGVAIIAFVISCLLTRLVADMTLLSVFISVAVSAAIIYAIGLQRSEREMVNNKVLTMLKLR